MTPSLRGGVHAVAASGNDMLAVGGSSKTRGSSFVLRSTDGGHSWRLVARGPGTFQQTSAPRRAWIEDVMRARGWWIAWGMNGSEGPAIWISRDGVKWRLAHESDSRSSNGLEVVRGTGGELLAFDDRARWSTDDPTDWGDPVPIVSPDDTYVLHRSIAPGAAAAVGIGLGPTAPHYPLFRSEDGGLTWTLDETFEKQFPDAQAVGVTQAGDVLVVVGALASDRPGAWIARDGSNWESLPRELPGGHTLGLVATIGARTFLYNPHPNEPFYLFDAPQ